MPGFTLNDSGNNLTVTGNVVNNGTFGVAGNQGQLRMTGAGTTISGNGALVDLRLDINANPIALASECSGASGGAVRQAHGQRGSGRIVCPAGVDSFH